MLSLSSNIFKQQLLQIIMENKEESEYYNHLAIKLETHINYYTPKFWRENIGRLKKDLDEGLNSVKELISA